MHKAAVEYIQLVYFYRLFLIRYIYLSNLTSLLAENEFEEDPSLGETREGENPAKEKPDVLENGAGSVIVGARYYDPKISMWISTDPALPEYLPTGEQLFFPEKVLDPYKQVKGQGGVYNTPNINLYHYARLNPVKYNDPDGKTWKSNFNFLMDWLTGGGSSNRTYDPKSVESKEMQHSPGANALREAFYEGGGKDIKSFSYGTVQAAKDTVLNPKTADWSETSAQVGGFGGATAKNNGDGTVTFTVKNVAGAKSFFYHLLPDRKGTEGPMRNIKQTFQWTEKIDATKLKLPDVQEK